MSAEVVMILLMLGMLAFAFAPLARYYVRCPRCGMLLGKYPLQRAGKVKHICVPPENADD